MAEINSNQRNKKTFEYIKEYWSKVYKDLEKGKPIPGLEVSMFIEYDFKILKNKLGRYRVIKKEILGKRYWEELSEDVIHYNSLEDAKQFLENWKLFNLWEEVE